ncbi:hypothetical protein ABPG72_015835 [Tetrahymena utriculariae]
MNQEKIINKLTTYSKEQEEVVHMLSQLPQNYINDSIQFIRNNQNLLSQDQKMKLCPLLSKQLKFIIIISKNKFKERNILNIKNQYNLETMNIIQQQKQIFFEFLELKDFLEYYYIFQKQDKNPKIIRKLFSKLFDICNLSNQYFMEKCNTNSSEQKHSQNLSKALVFSQKVAQNNENMVTLKEVNNNGNFTMSKEVKSQQSNMTEQFQKQQKNYILNFCLIELPEQINFEQDNKNIQKFKDNETILNIQERMKFLLQFKQYKQDSQLEFDICSQKLNLKQLLQAHYWFYNKLITANNEKKKIKKLKFNYLKTFSKYLQYKTQLQLKYLSSDI